MSNQNNDIPEGFKMTELGPLSEEWETTKLGDLFDIKQGKALSPEHRRGISPRPFLRTANVFWGYIDLANVDSMDFTDAEVSQLKLIPNDLLVCEGGDIGRTAIWRGDSDICCYQNHLHRLRTTRTDAYPLFYMYWMQAAYLLLGLYGGTGNKTTIPNLSQSRLKSFVLPLPPLPEQRAIAHVLSTIQQAIEAQDKTIAAARKLKKSLMHHLFTYGPVPLSQADQVSLKETEIGPIPEHWRVEKLIDVAINNSDIVGGPFGSNLKVSDYRDSGIPIIRLQNIERNRFINKDIKFISKGKAEELKYHSFSAGDIVLAKLGDPIGKTCIVPDELAEGIVVADVVRIRTSPALTYKDYVVYALNTDFCEEQFRSQKTGTTRPRVNVSNVRNILIPIPPIDEQQQIASILSAVDQKIEVGEKRKASLQTLLKTMLHQLMTGKVRVKHLEVTAA